MPEPKAGYRFVPLNSQVCPAPLGFAKKQPGQTLPQDKISLGRPLPNGYSGTIKVTWEAETPICVGQREKASQVDGDEKPGATRPFKLGDDYAIPGSSLKGMLRSVVEILSFSHLGQINDHHRFGYRDYRMPEYTSRVTSNDIKAGWLVYDDTANSWWLAPARGTKGYHYLPISTLENKPLYLSNWKEKSIGEKRRLILQKVRSEMVCFKSVYEGKSVIDSFSNKQQPGWSVGYFAFSDKVNTKSNKKYETIIEHPVSQDHWHSLDEDTIRQFSFINSKSVRDRVEPEGSWRYWLEATRWPEPLTGQTYEGKEHLESKLPGIPVFYCGAPGSGLGHEGVPFNMGLSRVIKIAYDHSVGQVAARTLGAKNNEDYSIPRLAGQGLDFARAIFGDVEETHEGRKKDKNAPRDALKGRVAFGFAWATKAQEGKVRDTILMGPRASFWPFYLHDTKDHSRAVTYNSPFAELAGRKRYPARYQAGGMPAPGKDQASVTSQVSFLEAGAKFAGEIRFHNLHPVELGALLCALALGDKDGHTRHSLGHAKAFGFGRLNCQYELFARPNYGQIEPSSPADFIRQFCAYMEDWYRSNRLGGAWAKSPQVLALLRTSYPVKSPDLHQRLGSFAEPKQFADFKKGPRPSALPGYVREFEVMESEAPALGAFLG